MMKNMQLIRKMLSRGAGLAPRTTSFRGAGRQPLIKSCYDSCYASFGPPRAYHERLVVPPQIKLLLLD